jgi:DNA-binding transcriptional LysR family regulator
MFATLAKAGSFTLAAKQLHLTQSAVSHGMKALEAEVGCRLLDKVGKKLLLTHAGEALLQRAEKILHEMNEARDELERLRQWGRGRLRVGASSTTCEYVLPSVLREFKESFPRCDVSIESTDATEALDLLRNRRVDLVLTLEPSQDEPFEYRHLFTDELKFLVSPLHPWAQLGRVPREDMAHQHFILYNRHSYTFRLIEKFLHEEGVVLRSYIEFGSMEAIKEMVKLGLGVSILAPWIAVDELAEGSLVALPLGRRKLKRRWGILFWRGRRLSLAEETFIGLCRSVTEDRGLRC